MGLGPCPRDSLIKTAPLPATREGTCALGVHRALQPGLLPGPTEPGVSRGHGGIQAWTQHLWVGLAPGGTADLLLVRELGFVNLRMQHRVCRGLGQPSQSIREQKTDTLSPVRPPRWKPRGSQSPRGPTLGHSSQARVGQDISLRMPPGPREPMSQRILVC